MNAMRRLSTPIGLALLVAAGSFPLLAQDPAKDAPETHAASPAAKRAADPSRRVPNHFGQVGLTAEQRESIYKIRKAHQEKVDALRAQIADVEAKSMTECEAVLNETQRKLLENLRAGRPAVAKPVETAKSTR